MKRSIISIFFVLGGYVSIAQSPVIEWQNTIGGFLDDQMRDVVMCTDGGYLLCGVSWSGPTGDKTEPLMGGVDFWIVKINSIGIIEWQNSIGGTTSDFLNQAIQTSDGGFLLGGYSDSGKNGDKSEVKIGSYDYWVIKLSSTGNILWQNTIGGLSYDYVHSVVQIPGGGYLIAGYSGSGISGDKTEVSMGNDDYWLLKLNDTGSIEWQNTIGGSGFDYLRSATLTADGGFLIGGYSDSNISGDKSENSYGLTDYWVLKLDNVGNIQWQKTIGGNNDDQLRAVLQTADGGYLLGGYSMSGISGIKSEANIGGQDYWIVKLDSIGNLLWENTIGGTSADYLLRMINTNDGGFLLGGYSASGISGDKNQISFGSNDYWVLKIDDNGNILWQRSVGGSNTDELRGIAETQDFGFILAGHSASPISGDKIEPPVGGIDFWVVKLAPCIEEICNAIDDDCNGMIDDGPIPSISILPDGPTTFCKGDNVLLSAMYVGESLQWKKDGAEIAGANSSSYLVTKKGYYSCSVISLCDTVSSDEIHVIVNNNPLANISAGGPTTFCFGGSVSLTVLPAAGCTYQWYKGGSSIAGATGTNYTATTAGNYRCLVTKTLTGCSKLSNGINVSVPCKEGDTVKNINIELYPNPASGIVHINILDIVDIEGTIQITDVQGSIIYSEALYEPGITIDINSFPAGIYFVKMLISDQELISKFIKQ